MRRLISRTSAFALSVTLTLGAAAVPCAAAEPATKSDGTLTRLSPASRQVLASPATPPALTFPLASPTLRGRERGTLRSTNGSQPAASPDASGSFFKTTRGKVTLALMGAGVGLTVWSIQHDRKPVKSPVR